MWLLIPSSHNEDFPCFRRRIFGWYFLGIQQGSVSSPERAICSVLWAFQSQPGSREERKEVPFFSGTQS